MVAIAPGEARGQADPPLGPATSALVASPEGLRLGDGADDVLLYRGVWIRLREDGRVERRVREVRRLRTDLAIAHLGDTRAAYDTTRQEIEIHVCRTIQKGGQESPALPRAWNRVTPERVARCPERAGLQEVVISFLGVERECVTELDYTVRDREAWRPWLEGVELLTAASPVLSAEIRIDAPALRARPAGVHATRGWTEVEPGVWRAGPLPALPDEPDAPDRPLLVYSTCRSWDDLARWLIGRLDDAAQADSAIGAWAGGDLPSGRPPIEDRERWERIGALVADRTIPADGGDLDWFLPIRLASRTFASSCGNPLDRAALALAAARASGLGARLRAVPAGPIAKEVPAFASLGELLLQTSSGTLSLRHGALVNRPGGARVSEVLEMSEKAASWIELPAPAARSRLRVRIVESAEGEEEGTVRGEIWLRLSGAASDGFEERRLRQAMESLAATIVEGGKLAGLRIDRLGADSIAVLGSFLGSGVGRPIPGGSGARILEIPEAPGASEFLPPARSLRRSSRAAPLLFPALLTEEVDLRLELLPSTRIRALPAPAGTQTTKAAGEAILFETAIEERPAGSTSTTLLYRRRLAIRDRTVEASAFPQAREALLLRSTESANRILLERVP
ncbi:MAG: DUF3857 domain-containing protein [Candidatus Eisenbacteria bacterium]